MKNLGFLFQNIDMGISKNKPFGNLRFDSQEPLLIKCIFRNPGLSISEKVICPPAYNRTDLFRRFGRNACFFDPGFSGSIKHLGAY